MHACRGEGSALLCIHCPHAVHQHAFYSSMQLLNSIMYIPSLSYISAVVVDSELVVAVSSIVVVAAKSNVVMGSVDLTITVVIAIV